jgi:hypothetical protein
MDRSADPWCAEPKGVSELSLRLRTHRKKVATGKKTAGTYEEWAHGFLICNAADSSPYAANSNAGKQNSFVAT